MAEILFITPQEITETTIMGGNVDPNRYVTNIAFAQVQVIEPLLGTELYNKIHSDVEGDTLTGLYLEMYEKYIQPITKHEAVAEYIEVSPFLVENGGTFKHTADNREVLSQNELQGLSEKYHSMAQMYVQRFEKWICLNNIPEYKRYQEEVNAQKIQTKSGMFFSDNYPTNYELL